MYELNLNNKFYFYFYSPNKTIRSIVLRFTISSLSINENIQLVYIKYFICTIVNTDLEYILHPLQRSFTIKQKTQAMKMMIRTIKTYSTIQSLLSSSSGGGSFKMLPCSSLLNSENIMC